MTDKDIAGKWGGFYIYGHGYSEQEQGITVGFDLELFAENGVITGYCTDDETAHLFETPASVRGFIEENFISFVKTYPCFCTIDEANEVILHPDIPSHEVHYFGLINNYVFRGDWEINYVSMDQEGNPIKTLFTGKWQMTKL